MSATGFHILKALTRPLAALPLGFHRGAGALLGFVAGEILRYRRDTVTVNLARSFPDRDYKEIKQIRRRFYRHFGQVLGESIWFGGCRGGDILARSGIVTLENPGESSAMFDSSSSIILLMSHLGNWELIAGFSSYTSTPLSFTEKDITAIYKKLSSDSWNRFMLYNRSAPIGEPSPDWLVESESALRYVLSHRGQKRIYLFITDQYPYNGEGEPIGSFMHQDTLSMTAAARLAVKLGMGVAYASITHAPDGNYRLVFEPIAVDATGMDPREIMAQYYSKIERDLEKEPWNYLWTHRRWKKNNR